jgi:peptide/nickel transport system permease protein
VITYFIPGLRFFHQGQFDGRVKRISPHLGRGPKEPVNLAVRQFYERLLDVLRRPFVRAARAKGLTENRVLFRHALRNALAPVLTLLGLQLPALFSGVVFVETIFAWPGMGRVAVQAVLARDYPVVMASTAVFATLVVAGNLLADLLVSLVDPRTERAA